MKTLVVRSPLGSAALALRNWAALHGLSPRNPEKAGAVANGIIAERLIARLPPSGSSFLDIGAHIGSVFSRVHRADRSVRIFAIEADAAKADSLRRSFGYCTVRNCAVGPDCGRALFYLRDRSGYNSLVGEGGGGEGGGGASVEVEVQTLDALFPDAVFETIKIDIEGAELGALRGGTALLARSRPTIMFESTHLAENALGYSAEGLWRWFDAAGFALFTPDRLAHDAPPLALESFLDAHHYPMRSHNFFAVPTEKRREIRDRARAILGI